MVDLLLDERVACSCAGCSDLCHGRPGWFRPGEATKAAASLGLSLQEFKEKYLEADFWVEREGYTYVLAPRQQMHDAHGYSRSALQGLGLLTMFDPQPRSPCALLGGDGCRLTLEHRPHECATTRSYKCPAFTEGDDKAREKIRALWQADPSELEGDNLDEEDE